MDDFNKDELSLLLDVVAEKCRATEPHAYQHQDDRKKHFDLAFIENKIAYALNEIHVRSET